MSKNPSKVITFSFDDGITQDIRLIELFNKYGLKCTFNINSGLLGMQGALVRNGRDVRHDKVNPNDVAAIYAGHEVAAHTRTHPCLVGKSEDFIIDEVERDRERLSELCGYEVVGMAYPCGGTNNDDDVARVLREHTGVKYSRTITSTFSFEKQSDLLRFNPTVALLQTDEMFKLGEQFLKLPSDCDALFYVWGHSFELDAWELWDRFEEFCRMIAGKNDIRYTTNRLALLGGTV